MKYTHAILNGSRLILLVYILALLSACSVKKSTFKIVKHSRQDTLALGAVKGIDMDQKVDKREMLFDEFIENDFKLSKKKRDSAAVVNYFRKTAFKQLGRKEFRQWDLVEVRGILFQVNVEKKPAVEKPLFSHQSIAEIIGLILMLFVYYF